jgi:dihydrofolate reductase
VSASAGNLAGQAFRAGLIDEVRIDLVPVVFGSGVRYFCNRRVEVVARRPGHRSRRSSNASALSGPEMMIMFRMVDLSDMS